MKPTAQISPAEQFDAGIAAGISPEQMLRNVDAYIRSTADAMAAECMRCPFPDYAAEFVRSQAELMIQARATRAYVLGRLLS